MKTNLIVLFLCFSCQSVPAQGVRGNIDCARWLTTGSAVSELGNKSWLVGFLSGLSMGLASDAQRKPVNFFENVTNDQIYLWMDNYCRANPLSSVMNGTGDLFQEISKKK
jgi:hypothetical protein